MELPKSQDEVGALWAKYVIERWTDNLHRLKIGASGELERSFRSHVETAAGGDLRKIELAYAWYGLMVDMGVGKGTKSGQQRDNADARRLMGKERGNARQPKKWQNRTTHGQVGKLADLLQENTGQRAGYLLINTLPRQIDFEL